MCAPAAIAGTALLIQAGSAVASHKAQADQSKAVARSARRSRILETRDIGFRQQEEGIAASRSRRDLRLQADEMAGEAIASAAEAGVEGRALDMILGEVRGSEGRAAMDIQDQYVATIEQLQRAKEGAFAREEARKAGVPGPSIAATGIRIGGAVTNAFTTFKQLSAAEELS